MKHDIFISYSRKDKDFVHEFVKEIEHECLVKCWIDLTGIESGEQFGRKIQTAIDNTDIVLFMMSENSMQSEWTAKEVRYASNTGRRVVPVLLPGAIMSGWFLFEFGNLDCIALEVPEQKAKLMNDIKSWTGFEAKQAEAKRKVDERRKAAEEAEARRKAAEEAEARRKAAEDAVKEVEAFKKAAEEAARKAAAEAEVLRKAAEEAAKKAAAEAEALKKETENVTKKTIAEHNAKMEEPNAAAKSVASAQDTPAKSEERESLESSVEQMEKAKAFKKYRRGSREYEIGFLFMLSVLLFAACLVTIIVGWISGWVNHPNIWIKSHMPFLWSMLVTSIILFFSIGGVVLYVDEYTLPKEIEKKYKKEFDTLIRKEQLEKGNFRFYFARKSFGEYFWTILIAVVAFAINYYYYFHHWPFM